MSHINKKPLIYLLTLLAVILVGFYIWRSIEFRVTGVSPSLSNMPDVTPYIDVNFNKELASTNVSITANPDFIKSYNASGKTIQIKVKTLADGQKYTFSLSRIKSKGGQMLNNTFSFKPKNIAFNRLPTSIQQALVNSQDPNNPSLPTNNPLLNHLPYGTPDYNISSVITTENNQPTLIIKVSVILAGSDYSQSPQALQSIINQREQEALGYIRSLGFDPAKYKIDFYVPPH